MTSNSARDRTLFSLFTDDAPVAYRRRRLIFLIIWLLVGAALVWPLFILSERLPSVLGLPGPLVWVICCLATMFGALIWLYLGENHPPNEREV
jgi:hypothetical protein